MKINDMGIYIPSSGRENKQITIANLPKEILPITRIAVPEEEVDNYKKYNKNVVIWGCPKKGVSATRQFIMEYATHNYVLMIDDDMSFQRRVDGKIVPCTEEDFIDLLETLYYWLHNLKYVHVGISQRAGNNHIKEAFVDIARMNNTYAYDKDVFLKTGVRFDRLQVMEDFDVTLSLLEKGHPNRVTYEFCWSQTKSGAAGGCSTYRTFEVQRDAAKALAKLHGNVVRIVNKTAKVKWESIGLKRCDVNISWKEAYHPIKRAAEGISSFLKR